ncbi:MAG TPA: helix-turn-helix transcriptional regulator [Myxococcales bacterium]|nr:helix-turn-helix transcriptional regulator [Myxococcales bacterium]
MPKKATVPELNARLATRLRQLRADHALTQEALAAKAGISADAVRRLERGAFSPTLRLLSQLAAAFNLTAAELADLGEGKAVVRVTALRSLLADKSDREVALVLRIARAALHE